ncbi:MAG: hypothetical protein JRG96_05415 [Deltaproteobacteria bacterium]|nr:hypothetical protein [Deltaproteobacteria bacterium]
MLAIGTAHAGPPLLSDDPHTVGPGRVEAIVAATAFGFEDSANVAVPLVDLTVGLFEGFDVAVALSPAFTVSPDAPVETRGAASLGLKWQPLRGDHWNASFTPTVSLNAPLLDETNVLLPVQIEYGWKRLSLGVDGGYVVDLDHSDLWFVAVYGGWSTSESLTVLAELWGGRARGDERSAAGLTLGLDWVMPWGPHLLASCGPGFETSVGRRVRWAAYLGLQWDFALWSRD